jgi:predicted permease
MNTLEILLQQIGLFVIYILAGMILVKTKVLNSETLDPISRFVIKMALPVMIFVNIIDGVERDTLFHSLSILVIAAVFYICTFIISLGMTKIFHLGGDQAGIYQAMFLFGNVGFMGIPIITSIFPQNGILYVSVFTVIDQFMLWTMGVKLTTPCGKGKFDPRKLVNPATVAIFAALFLVVTGIKIPQLLDTGLQKIGATASPLAMIYVGGVFACIDIRRYIKELSLYGIVLVKMLLIPVIMYGVLNLFPISEEIHNGSDRRNAGDDFCSYDGKQRWLRWRLCTGRCVRDDDMQHCDTAVYLLAFAVHIIRKKKKIKLCRNGSGKRLIFFFFHLRDITGEQ